MKDTGETFFFKGEQCWKFKNSRLQSGYPKFISETFPGIPGNIDAAFVWGGNDKFTSLRTNNTGGLTDSRYHPHQTDILSLYQSGISLQNWRELCSGEMEKLTFSLVGNIGDSMTTRSR